MFSCEHYQILKNVYFEKVSGKSLPRGVRARVNVRLGIGLGLGSGELFSEEIFS